MVAFADIIDFLLTLLTDDAARAEFDENPQQALQDAGLEGVTAADIRDARLQLADSGAVTATDDGRGSSYPDGDDPVREIGYTTQHYVADENVVQNDAGQGDLSLVNQGDTFVTIDDRDTLFFQSISDDDVTISQDNSVNNQLAIQDNDVNVSDDDTTINAEDSFNSDDDQVAIQDNDVNGGDEVIDIDVTGGVGSDPDEPEAPDADLAAISGPSELDAVGAERARRRGARGGPRGGLRARGGRRASRSTRSRWTRRRTTPTPTIWLPTTSPPTTHCRCEAVDDRTDPVAVVERARAAIARYDRPDLDARLAAARARLLDDRTRVLVVGEFKQGKSLLVNGLVGRPVCPTFDDVATAVPTVVRHADALEIAMVRPDGERVGIKGDELADHVCEQGNPGNREGWSHAEIGLPRPVLKGGLEIVDTPGVGGLSSVHGAATTAALPSADAVLLVSDAAQEYTAPELEFLAHAASVCPNVACVITKTDLHPEWRRIVELDRGHLAAAGINAELFAVSSTLRWHAVLHGDAELNAESGFPELVGYLRKRVLGQADRLARRGVVHDVLAVTEQIGGNLRRRAHGAAGPGGGRRAQPRADRGPGARDRAQGALGALAADPQRRHRRPQRRHRLRPARPDAGDQPARRGRAARRRRPGEGVGPVRRLGAAGGRRGGGRQLHLGDAAGARAGQAGRRALLRRPRPAAAGAAQRPVRRDPVGAGDDRPGGGGAGAGHEGADRAARRLHGHADVRDARHVRRVRLADQPGRHRGGHRDGREGRSATSARSSSPGGRTRPRPPCAATSTT